MRVLVVEPERRPGVKEIDGSLKSMQEVVGGWILIFGFDCFNAVTFDTKSQ